MTLQRIGFKFFAKLMRGSCVFCCLSCISLNPKSHLKNYYMFIAKENSTFDYLWFYCCLVKEG